MENLISMSLIHEMLFASPELSVSVTSPVARALIGKEVGDSVEVRVPAGTREYEVRRVQAI